MIPSAEVGELEAFRSLLAGQEQAEIGGALCTSFALTPGSALFNRALGLGLREPATEAALDEIDAFFTRRGLAYGITLTPDAQPPELPEWLEARGFQRGYAWTKFAQSAEPSPRRESDLRVEELGADQANLFADVFVRAYGTPEVTRPLLARIPGWQEALRQQVDVASGSKPFFNEDIRMLHGGGRDQRGQDDVRVSTKQRELEFLGRLQRTLML